MKKEEVLSIGNGRKEKVIKWLSKTENILFIGIIVFAIAIRLYFFVLTKNQPLWWDESDYLAYAKNLAGFNVDWIVSAKHNSIYYFIAAAIFKIGFSELIAKFVLQIVPSILTVVLVYYVAASMYKDRRIALIASFLMATFWVHLFNTMRFHIGILSMFFGILAIYVFWQGYEKKQKIFGKINPKWTIPLTVIFVMLTYTVRRGYFLYGLFFFVYMIFSRKWKELLKDKYNWIGLGIFAALFLFSEKFIFISRIGSVSEGYYHGDLPINFLPLDVFPAFFNSMSSLPSVLLFLFWTGFLVMLVTVFISFDKIRKMKNSINRSDLFNLLTIIITIAFFILVLRSQTGFGEPRWYFPLAFAAFIGISRGTIFLTDFIRPYSKYAAMGFIVILIGFGGYYEVQHGKAIIENKADSYSGIREAGLYLKEISSPDDLIIVQPQPQTAYYAERKVIRPALFTEWTGESSKVPFEDFLDKIKETPEARYILVSFSEPNHPDWMKQVQYANRNGQTVVAAWKIPFMNTTIDFINGMQDIKSGVQYGDITFNLVEVKQDIFIYEIIREN